ncbi:MAG: dihydropteroate synthase [Pseudoruegeria sp.]
MTQYYRPIPQIDPARPATALPLAGGWCWFSHVEVLSRLAAPQIIPADALPSLISDRLTQGRAPIAGLGFSRPNLMGILNVTPDSFSDGGKFLEPGAAIAHAKEMQAAGADILDIGGESTRPGAVFVPAEVEIARTAPVIQALSDEGIGPISIDTRKSRVAEAALKAGAALVNDVYAFTYDPTLMTVTSAHQAPVCLMHAQGDPETMQSNPCYDNVLLDVYDFLEERVSAAEAAGIPRNSIIVDPGIGFGKIIDHNLTLLQRISLFHALGCVVLLGASRKRFIGDISGAVSAEDRAFGSVSVALTAVAQGVQILRVHDTKETKQALDLMQAVQTGTR